MGDGEEFTQHHIKVKSEDVSRYCIIPGDHERGKKIASRLAGQRLVSETRGYRVYRGTFMGTPITVCSTGMGGPQVAIAMEELGNLGADTFIRLGSSGGLDPRTGVGDIVVATASYRGGGTADEYLPKGFPAVADFAVTRTLVDAAADLGIDIFVGPVASVDAFYRPDNDTHNHLLRMGGILSLEMEADTVFIVGMTRGFRCGAAFVLDNGPRTAQVGVRSGVLNIANHAKDPDYVYAEERLIDVGLLAMSRLAEEDS
ncbi:MAG: nucleoside phosphorylase [Bacillota bacterium]